MQFLFAFSLSLLYDGCVYIVTNFDLMNIWVKRIALLIIIALGVGYWSQQQSYLPPDKSQAREQIEQAIQSVRENFNQSTQTHESAHETKGSGLSIRQVHEQELNKVIVTDHGEVVRVLPDDLKGDRHQRFIVRTSDGTVLIIHNIDVAPRLPDLNVGDQVVFKGEFIQNSRGGLVHWTHCGRYQCKGWLEYKGKRYQ